VATTHDIIVIGASAGGVEAITAIVADLPRDLRASIFIVLHMSRGRSMLAEILNRAGRMPAAQPTDGETLQYGRVYVASPDHHMVIENGVVRMVHSAAENGVRPAVDPLFRSAARAYGSRVVGVVLTGNLDDGTAGLAAIKGAGGVTIVQDPDEAFAPGMPRSAMAAVEVDHVLPLQDIPVMLTALTQEMTGDPPVGEPSPHLRPMEPDLGQMPVALEPADRPGRVSVLTCPECHGTLWEADEDGILRFRCRVGHVYSAESMLAAQTDEVDRALWIALRTLEERVALTCRLAERARRRTHHWIARAFEQRARDTELEARSVRELLRVRRQSHSVPDAEGMQGPGGPVSVPAERQNQSS
jgi:two-component system, chemotaxis family, protein-glutamate methylesterase/glutaminase